MYVSHLTLHQFRSHAALEVALEPGVTAFLGPNGQGKTNIVEAVDYLARLSSHRVASDAPLVAQGAEQALVRAAVVKDGRTAVLEVEINPGRANRARVNRSPLPRARDIVGLLRTVLFSPEDLSLVKGDPSERRRFLDDLLVLRTPRLAGVRADFDRVLKQRNALLKQAGAERRGRSSRPDEHFESTLAVWDEQLVRLGSEITAARAALVDDLLHPLAEAYATVAKESGRNEATVTHQPSVVAEDPHDRESLAQAYATQLAERRREEVQRGLTLVGPHRDELALAVGTMPVKGYASHGETWSYALALRLASYSLLREEGDDPILVLDDVFAELDTDRRTRLAEIAAGAEQVLVTAAVEDDVPQALAGARVHVRREG
ncbi:DNA replication/repair protein RecF [Nocardioides marmoribigeumensis]|uniref:DNA replication and repair protein RecF n=1 Tax=Nocardioides marmoribigeumensis TaxID=433649 RepID=A0ABU2BUM9_9ACTN|nr:DNA replication/repair protein RecF [Nocardioides marmoribigeumensis]MDR7362341.1 DNA replication and repair protein RecF [Nocardioides marmoribigeumensis]